VIERARTIVGRNKHFRGQSSGNHRRFEARLRLIAERGGAVRCPDCNAECVSAAGVRVHKSRGMCIVIPGARERLAVKIVEFIMHGAA
jgi:hypothetical protein